MFMDIRMIPVEKPADTNFIFGMTHFIKSVDDLHEMIVQTNPAMKFGIAFCEASGPCLIRVSGNDEKLKQIAVKNAFEVGAGHTFFVFIENGFPINVLNSIKLIPEVCQIFCATSNNVKVIVSDDGIGRGVLGVIDGESPKGIETEADEKNRKNFLKMIGYKL
jgi:uncharacterized protein